MANLVFTYDPRIVDPSICRATSMCEVYRALFEESGSTDKNVIFDDITGETEGSQLSLERLLETTRDADLIIHNLEGFGLQFALNFLCLDPCEPALAAQELSYDLSEAVDETICEGLFDLSGLSIFDKKYLQKISKEIGVKSPTALRLDSFRVSPEEALSCISDWEHGVYVKHKNQSSGRLNDYYEMGKYGDIVELANSLVQSGRNKAENFLVQKRIPTPHPDCASHYRGFMFANKGKAHIIAAVICYNRNNPYTFHGTRETEGAIALTGPQASAKKVGLEKDILHAHRIYNNRLPPRVAEVMKKVALRSHEYGKAICSVEVVESKFPETVNVTEDIDGLSITHPQEQRDLYVIDVNPHPAMVSVGNCEFDEFQGYKELYRRAAQKILKKIIKTNRIFQTYAPIV